MLKAMLDAYLVRILPGLFGSLITYLANEDRDERTVRRTDGKTDATDVLEAPEVRGIFTHLRPSFFKQPRQTIHF